MVGLPPRVWYRNCFFAMLRDSGKRVVQFRLLLFTEDNIKLVKASIQFSRKYSSSFFRSSKTSIRKGLMSLELHHISFRLQFYRSVFKNAVDFFRVHGLLSVPADISGWIFPVCIARQCSR